MVHANDFNLKQKSIQEAPPDTDDAKGIQGFIFYMCYTFSCPFAWEVALPNIL